MRDDEERRVKTGEVAGYAEAIGRLRSLPEGAAIIDANFLEPDLVAAAERFWQSREWRDTVAAVRPEAGMWVLDYGAGRCLASMAFARLGCRVVALDINPSPVVGLGVIAAYDAFRQRPVYGVLGDGERAPFPAGAFDIVYCREALHHAFDLERLAAGLVAMLRPGGRFYAYGEHRHPFWSSDAAFRRRHPAVESGANEHSYTTADYKAALRKAGLAEVRAVPVLSPLFASGPAPLYHRLAAAAGRLPAAGPYLYGFYHRAQMYRSTGSQIILIGRK